MTSPVQSSLSCLSDRFIIKINIIIIIVTIVIVIIITLWLCEHFL